MEINQLRYFEAAAYGRSFSQAAESCFTSRQNVSHAVRNLEGELGVQLFERRGKALVLTPAGEVILRQARFVLDTIDGMKGVAGRGAAGQPHVKMAISPNLLSGVSADIGSIVERYVVTDQIVELSCRECYERVRDRSIDIAIVNALERDFPGCHAQKVSDSPSYLLVGESSRLAERTHYSVADLIGVSLILMPDFKFQYKPLFDLLGTFNASEERVATVVSTSSMLHIVKRMEAGAIVTDTFSANAPKGTVAIPIIDPRVGWHTYVLHNDNPGTYDAVEDLTRSLRSAMGQRLKRAVSGAV